MKNKKFLIAAFALLFALGSCKKETTPSTTSKTKNEYLTLSSWKLTAVTGSTNGAAPIDYFTTIALPCEKDNIYTFSTNSAYSETEGVTKCDPADPQTVDAGNWAFATNETYLNITITGTAASYKILTLDANTLKLQYTEAGTVYDLTWTH
jgi:hypothetical protein